MQLGTLRQQVQTELANTDQAKNWFFENFSAKSVDVSTEVREDDPMQQKYFNRSRFMKQRLQEQFPKYGEAFLDYLTEQFYEELFPQD
jgi:hypothetical protein